MTREHPPATIEPRTFFEEWLPAAWARELAAGKRTRAAASVEVRVRLDGDGGGAWDLALVEERLVVAAAAGGERPVTLLQTVEDWRELLPRDGGEGAPPLAPPGTSPLDLLFLDPALRQLLGTLRGAVRFEVTEYRGRTWSLTLKLGDQPAREAADATISVDAGTYGQMLAKKMLPPEAYFAGKIRVHGDAGLAMQLGMALLPRFSR